MQVGHLRNQVGNCGEQCEGLDAEDDESLCPACCDAFARVLAEEERLAEGKEYSDAVES